MTEKQNRPTPDELTGRLGYREIPEALSAAEVPIERGHHLVLAVGRGAGEDAVYAMAAAAICEPGPPGQALVLVPSRNRALELALALQRALSTHGLRAAAPGLRADGSLDTSSTRAECLIERPSLLLPEVRLGRLHVGGLRLLVIDGLADLEDIEEWASAEPLLETLDEEARRVVATRRVDDALLQFVQRQLPRARRWPEELFQAPGQDGAPAERGTLGVGAAPTEEERLALLLQALNGRADSTRVRVRCRNESSIPGVAAALESAGFRMEDAEGWDVGAGPPGEEGGGESADASTGTAEVALWFGLPLSADSFAGTVETGEQMAIVDPLHVAQLLLLAGRAALRTRFLPGLVPAEELDPIGRYRNRVRVRIQKGGADAELLVLEPLLREFGSVRVAAALSDMLRRMGAVDAGVRPWPDVEAASLGSAAPVRRESRATPEHRGVRGAWSRIFIGVGNRDSVRAGDLVGAIAGETGIAGGQIGKIEIRAQFSLVEIDSQVVDQVIRKLNGATIRGRAVTVKHDREG